MLTLAMLLISFVTTPWSAPAVEALAEASCSAASCCDACGEACKESCDACCGEKCAPEPISEVTVTDDC